MNNLAENWALSEVGNGVRGKYLLSFRSPFHWPSHPSGSRFPPLATSSRFTLSFSNCVPIATFTLSKVLRHPQ